ncbi:hypothetical protein M0802_010005 [Mischocyttarus mexicanus]|nr:hypothetical protein M0802_010005 [Mischocyttarus mexicanus]
MVIRTHLRETCETAGVVVGWLGGGGGGGGSRRRYRGVEVRIYVMVFAATLWGVKRDTEERRWRSRWVVLTRFSVATGAPTDRLTHCDVAPVTAYGPDPTPGHTDPSMVVLLPSPLSLNPP